jgi:rfaE bifunctional protein kinase chain/domain
VILSRFQSLTSRYSKLRVGILGDFCLDRYLEIDPRKKETSIETGLEVHNVINIRSQPGAAGTILNNLAALGIGEIFPAGFCGIDGEGFELRNSLRGKPGVRLDFFFETPERRTFTYTKPLRIEPGKIPVELNRLDVKNWTPTPSTLSAKMRQAALELAAIVDAIILLDQVDLPETGVVTTPLLQEIEQIARQKPNLLILADSRRGLGAFPPVTFKMNHAELARLENQALSTDLATIGKEAVLLAQKNQKPVFVTLAEHGILGAAPTGEVKHLPALPLRGEIDIVGAGDAVTANLTAALAAGSNLKEALELATLAASLVIHQLGTTGDATPRAMQDLLTHHHQ